MTPPIIAPVLFAPEFDGTDAASTVVAPEGVAVGCVVGEGLVCDGPLAGGELEGGVDVDVTVAVGVVVNAEYRSVVGLPPQAM